MSKHLICLRDVRVGDRIALTNDPAGVHLTCYRIRGDQASFIRAYVVVNHDLETASISQERLDLERTTDGGRQFQLLERPRLPNQEELRLENEEEARAVCRLLVKEGIEFSHGRSGGVSVFKAYCSLTAINNIYARRFGD